MRWKLGMAAVACGGGDDDDSATVSKGGGATTATTVIPGDLQVGVVHGDVYITVEDMQIQGGPAASRRDDVMSLAEAAVGAL